MGDNSAIKEDGHWLAVFDRSGREGGGNGTNATFTWF
jgi:hypothetical protein